MSHVVMQSDMNHKCHIVAMGVSTGKTKDSYKEMLESVKEASFKLLGKDVSRLKTAISDNAPQIRAAAEEAFTGINTMTCYAHMTVMGFTPGQVRFIYSFEAVLD